MDLVKYHNFLKNWPLKPKQTEKNDGGGLECDNDHTGGLQNLTSTEESEYFREHSYIKPCSFVCFAFYKHLCLNCEVFDENYVENEYKN